MNKNRLLETFKALVSIDSPSFGERDMCDYLKEYLVKLGFEIFEDDTGRQTGGNSGNLYAYLDGDNNMAPLLFSSHMDTVEPAKGKRAIIHDDGKITSAGNTVLGADDFAGVCAILEAVKTITESNLSHRPIELLFPAAEEHYGLGSQLFDYSRIKSTEAYVLDLTGPVGNAANKAPTILTFAVNIKGKAAHAGFASADGIHAVLAASTAITNIPMGQIDEETTCNIGIIKGGVASNIIPADCFVKGEIRSYSHEKAMAQAEIVKKEFESAAKAINAMANVEIICNLKAYETDSSHPVVLRLKKACEALNLPFELRSTFGGSDNNNFALHGINGLVLSSAMENCHSLDEYTYISEIEKLAELTIELMTK